MRSFAIAVNTRWTHVAGLLAALAGGCSPEDPRLDCPGGVCSPPDDLGVRPDAGTHSDLGIRPIDTGPGHQAVVSIALRPAMATLVHRDNAPATETFRVVGILPDGAEVGIGQPTYTLAANRAAVLDGATGALRTTGEAGATLALGAELVVGGQTLRATARAVVRVERSAVGAGLLPDVAARFAGTAVTDPARAVLLHYPLDAAVIPNNLAPIDVQWERGAPGDVFRVRLRKPHVDVSGYVTHTGAGFDFRWSVTQALWRALLESDPGDPLTVSVERWVAATNTHVAGPSVSLSVARAALSGSIYFWDLSGGRIERIDAITAERTSAVPNPPPRPVAPDQGSRCIACHTVSRDGRYMSVEMWGGDRAGAVFDLTDTALRNDPAPTVVAPQEDRVWLFSTFSPDSAYLAVNRATGLRLLRREGGGVYVDNTGLPTTATAHPTWSPDGNTIAVATNIVGPWAVDFTAGDLGLIPRTGETTFGPPRVVHRATSSPGGTVDAHPSFSPDGRWLAFQHGVHSRSGDEHGMRYPARLEILPADAMEGATPLVLSNASGDMDGYWPNFSPFNAGGYYWLAFYSRRDYGNAQAGTRGSRRRQIWVTAVRNTPTSGSDPSAVPYWLPGQNPAVENISAQWAPIACRMNTERCTVSSECCSGTCERQPDGMYACQPPPPAMCRRIGSSCSNNADCCEGLFCVANVCGAPPG